MIATRSKFIYGATITVANNNGDFNEGSGALLATVDANPYSLGEALLAIADALSTSGSQTYSVTIDRTTGLVTISAAANFSLLLGTGTNRVESFWALIGFTQGTDLTGTNTYTGVTRAGTTYKPQFLLQSYVSPDDSKAAIDPVVNRTSSGRTELVSFGVDRFIEMDIQFITDLPMDGVIIFNHPTGKEDANAFLDDITQKTRFEFVPDVDTPSTVYKCVLESFQGFSMGTGYKLKEMISEGLPNIWSTGVMILRVVT